ncbi:MAG: serine/threonine-protein kinase [Archangium sp.]|nr:serine/threonine-protein kinase [Archangium sp.]
MTRDETVLEAHGFSDARLMASGGAARVYQVVRDGRPLALKVVGVELAPQLVIEARLLVRVGAPYVPVVHAVHHRLLVLEWLEGQTIDRTRPGANGGLSRVARSLTEALANVHRLGLVHRDIKGSNVMVEPSGRARLFDFGLASEGQTIAARRQGTPTTMAPESWEGGAVGPAADVYALGVLLFEVLTGRPLFEGDASTLEAAHRQLRAPAAGLGAALDAVLARCLEKAASQRYPDAGAVLDALVPALENPGAVAPQPARPASAAAELTALVAVHTTLSLPTLAKAMEAEGAVWAGALPHHELPLPRGGEGLPTTAHFFARPHPLGPAQGLANLEAALASLSEVTSSTLHVAPLKVRVGSTSVRISGPALQNADWVQSAGRSVTTEAASHLASRPRVTPTLRTQELPWLDDGSRLPPILAALERPEPQLIWVRAPSGSGRTRLLHELERVLKNTSWLNDPKPDGVLLVDDAEHLSWANWEMLEASTAPGASTRRAVVLVADERLPALRPGLGSRAASFVTVTPTLLADTEAAQLVRVLLAPAELIPDEVVVRLARAGEGHPGHLVELVDVLRRRGLLAPDANTGEWRLASESSWSELTGERSATLAQAALAGVPGALHDVARLLALAEWRLTAEDLQRALSALPASFEARRFDAATALARLSALGLLVQRGVRRALAAQPGPRAVELHRALASVLAERIGLASLEAEASGLLAESLGAEVTPRLLSVGTAGAEAARASRLRSEGTGALAQHAHAAGWQEAALPASTVVGLRALSEGDALSAEGHLTRALALENSDGLRLARAIARRQLEHFAGALSDARAVKGDGAARIAAHLEASLSLDWMNEFASANEEAEAALRLGGEFEAAPSALGLALRLARGRLHVRAGRWAEATEVLAPLCEVTPRPGEVETVLGAFALAASVACVEGALERSETLFAAGLALWARCGHPVVGCALLINRPMLWMARGQVDEALSDLAEAARSSRRLGHAQIERVASHNLAQYLLWLGRVAESEALARRAVALAKLRLGEAAPAADALLLARVAVEKGDAAEARALVRSVGTRSLNPSEALQRDVVLAWLGEGAWTTVLVARDGVVPDELLDAARLAAGAGVREAKAVVEALSAQSNFFR